MLGYGYRVRRPVVIATLIDVCCVLAFVTVGRRTHHDGDSLAGIWHTAWPFLAGLLIGLAAARCWRQPVAIWPAGLGAWLGAAVAGMAIRVAAGQGTAVAFIAVALAFLGLFVLGWRCVTIVFSHVRHMSP
jgi:peptidoglycan/LPS O-acetylase OafA/YrhL